jgi:ParB family chromosome partitioning protein
VAKGGLGKGLGSLMGNAAAEAGSNTDIIEVSLDKITPNPNQPRNNFSQEKIDELAKSIAKDGLLQPIIVRPFEDGYQIVAGERRYHACKKVGLDTIPVKVVTIDELHSQEIALVENLQRDNLNPIEEAWGYKRLMELGNYKQKDIANAISKDASTISNSLRLLDLPEEVQEMMFDGKLSAGHARAILSLPVEEEEKRISLAKKIADEGLSVREAENIARLYSIQGLGKTKKAPSPKSFKVVARKLRKKLDAPVKVRTSRGKNKIEIEFTDEDDLERIYKLLAGMEVATDNASSDEEEN